MLVTLDHIEPLTTNIKSFWFRPDTQLIYTAGQYIEMYLPHNNPDGRGQKHWFTLSSSPTEQLLSITTKFSEPGSTFKHVLKNLKPGDQIRLSEAMGDFVLPKDTSIPLVFVAGGMGVTPFRSMTKWLIDNNHKRQLQVVLAVTLPQDIIFNNIFEAYGLKPTIIVSHPTSEWNGESGLLNAGKILGFIGSPKNKRIYLSGPEQMVEALEKELKGRGVPGIDLVGDFFPGYPDV